MTMMIKEGKNNQPNKQTDRQADKQMINIVNVDFIWFS